MTRTPPRVARPVGLLVAVGLVVTALVAPVAEAKPLLAGRRRESDDVALTLSSGASDISWNDVLAGVAAGAVLAYLVARVLHAARRARSEDAAHTEG